MGAINLHLHCWTCGARLPEWATTQECPVGYGCRAQERRAMKMGMVDGLGGVNTRQRALRARRLANLRRHCASRGAWKV